MNGQVLHAVAKGFKDNHWKYLWVEIGGEIRLFTLVQMKNSDFLCMSSVREENNEFVFSTYYDVKVPESKRQEAAEFFARVNDGLMIGNFEMDMEDGEVCFRAGIAVADQHLTSSEIKYLLLIALSTTDHYLPGLMTVMSRDEPQKEQLHSLKQRQYEVVVSG
jgi:hypothetical protein